MSHGFLGLTKYSWVVLTTTTGFLYYLSTAHRGPSGPKFEVEPILVDIAKQYQPGLQAEYYYKKPKAQ